MNFSDRLTDIRRKHRVRAKLVQSLDYYTSTLESEERKLAELTSVLEKEYKDYETLTRVNLKSLFYKLINHIEERLEKEKAEYLRAKLAHRQQSDYVALLRVRIQEEQKRMSALGDVEAQYRETLKEKERYLVANQAKEAKEIIGLSEEIAAVDSVMKEIEEALEAGRKAQAHIGLVLNKLNAAEGLGVLDMFFGGIIVTAMKHNRIDDAMFLISETQFLLKDFNRELQDLALWKDAEENLEIGEFLSFADYFFDGFFVDMAVQRKIEQAIDKVTMVDRRLTGTLESLVRDREVQRAERKRLVQSKQLLVERA